MDNSGSKPSKWKSKKNSSQNEFYKRYMNVYPSIGPLGEDNDSNRLPPLKYSPPPAPKR
ncbi:hypothetical protein J1N35_044260, partial [Gossypium stocksii]